MSPSSISNAVLSRRQFIVASGALSAAATIHCESLAADSGATPSEVRVSDVRDKTLRFIESMRVTDGPYGRYHYAAGCRVPTLYSSTYAAMTRHLYGDLDSLTTSERAEWIEYLQSHQDDDGLYRDPVIFDQGWYKGDPEWCGRRHLSSHVVTALTCLGAVAKKPLRDIEPFLQPGGLAKWLATRDWDKQPDFVGNEVLNVGTLLQYARDFQKDERCRPVVGELLDWMTSHHMSEQTGLWGQLDLSTPHGLSRAVMGGYHFWLLYFYDRVAIPHADRATDMCLKTQNKLGGFGQGVHGGDPLRSSACEDIDSIDPLARLLQTRDYRSDDIRAALERGLSAVLTNQAPDGGFWFLREKPFSYGHEQLASTASQGAMFPTWFRTLTLAYLGKALPESSVGKFDWRFCNCPGIQFWMTPGDERSSQSTAILRTRRVLYNFDGDSCLSTKAGGKGSVPVNGDDVKRLIEEVAYEGSQVDTILVCVNAQVMYYPTKVGTMRGTLSTAEERAKWPASEKQRFENLKAFFDSGVDPYAVMLAEAKRRGREALLTFRMNDDHGNDFLRTQFLVDHPEWRLGTEQYRGKGAMDFARDEVRDYTFRLIEEAVRRYDCDGIELDFNRFPTFFKDGTTEERVTKMNSLVERVRKMLDGVGRERGRRLVLSVRPPSNGGNPPPTPETARQRGCDVPAWVTNGWVDFVAVSEFLFERGDLPIDQWKQAITTVPVYGGIECTRGGGQKSLTADEYRAAATQLLKKKSDGIYLFNFFTSREEGEKAYEPPFEVLRDLNR